MNTVDDIVDELRRLLTEGGDGNYLVLSSDVYYVQFTGQPGDTGLHCEAVSDVFLPDDRALSEQGRTRMEALGFRQESSGENFHRTFDVASDEALRHIAGTALSIFEQVYGCGPAPVLEREIELGSIEHPDNPDLEEAIDDLLREENDDTRYGLMSNLADAVLIVPVCGEDPLVITDEAGQQAVPVFTNRHEQLAWTPGDCSYRPVNGIELVLWAQETEAPALVFNPAGGQALLLPLDTIRDLAASFREMLEDEPDIREE